MTAKAKFNSDAFDAVHSASRGLHRACTIDKATMRGFDETCPGSTTRDCARVPALSQRNRPALCSLRRDS